MASIARISPSEDSFCRICRPIAPPWVKVKTYPCIHTNSGDTCRAAALAHQGAILQPTFFIGDDLAAGTLVELMPGFHSIGLGIHAICPARTHVSPKVWALVDFLPVYFEHTRSAR